MKTFWRGLTNAAERERKEAEALLIKQVTARERTRENIYMARRRDHAYERYGVHSWEYRRCALDYAMVLLHHHMTGFTAEGGLIETAFPYYSHPPETPTP